MPYQREAVIVLEMWRDVEQAMRDADLGPDAIEVLKRDAARLRNEYQRLVAEAMEHQRPQPPPFPNEGPQPEK
jgi:hypothetical protein